MLVQSDDIKLAPNHAEMPSLLARMKPSALAKHVQKQKVREAQLDCPLQRCCCLSCQHQVAATRAKTFKEFRHMLSGFWG